jgi:hypothetical protein
MRGGGVSPSYGMVSVTGLMDWTISGALGTDSLFTNIRPSVCWQSLARSATLPTFYAATASLYRRDARG